MDIDDTPYPEILIVVITSHGKIEIDTTFDGKKEPEIFGIPHGMTLTRVNAVAPGLCNYLSDKTARTIVGQTKEMVEMYDLGKRSSIPSNFVKYLARDLKEITDTDKKAINVKDYKSDDEEIAYINAYNIHYNKAYKSATHVPYTFALNKIYSVDQLSQNYNDKILLLNTPQGEVDYFTTLNPPYNVDLKTLVLDLASKGVKHILLIDLSCAVFNDKTVTPRDERSMRRESHIEGWWGGKKKSKKSTNKGTNKGQKKLKRNRRTRKFLH